MRLVRSYYSVKYRFRPKRQMLAEAVGTLFEPFRRMGADRVGPPGR